MHAGITLGDPMVSFAKELREFASFLMGKDGKNASQAEPFPVSSTAPSTALVPYSAPETIPLSTPDSTPLSAPISTQETTQERTPRSTLGSTSEAAPIHATYDAGTVVDVSRRDAPAAHPEMHAIKLLGLLLEDGFAGQPATEKALRKYYLAACRDHGLRPFSWLVVVRRLNVLLRRIYGSAYQKTYKNVYDGGRLRKRLVYRVPTAEEIELAFADPDATVVELAGRRRA